MQIFSPESLPKTHLEHSYRLLNNPEETLILMVHGKAGSYKVMWLFDRCLPEHVNILAPQADIPDPLGGYSWWLNVEKDDFIHAAEKLNNFLSASLQYYNLKPKRIIALGFSQGGAVLSVLSQLKPDLFYAIGLLCSFYIKIDSPASFPKFFIAHGYKDDKITFSRAEEGINYLKERATVITAFDDTAHKIGLNGMRELRKWLLDVS